MHPRFFARYLPEFGIQPHVVTASSSTSWDDDGKQRQPRVTRVPQAPESIRQMKSLYRWESYLGWRLKVPGYGRPWIRHAVKAADEQIRQGSFDIMISLSPSFVSHAAAYQVKRKHPTLPWIAYFADPYVGNPFNPSNPLMRRVERWNERRVFNAARNVIANTDTVEASWRERYPEHAHKFLTIWNGYDPAEEVRPLPFASTDCPVLAHVGALYGSRFPMALLQSMNRLLAAEKISPGDFVVELTGHLDPVSCPDPALLAWLREKDMVRVRGPVSRVEAIRIAAQAQYLLLLDVNEFNTKFQVPSKLFDYLRIGRPILSFTPEGSPVEKILAESGIEHRNIYPGAAPDLIDRAFLDFFRLAPESRPMSAWAARTFNARNMTETLAKLIGRSEASASSLAA